jgi:hypothetical protein
VGGSSSSVAAFHLEDLPDHGLVDGGELRSQGGDDQPRGSTILRQGPGGGESGLARGMAGLEGECTKWPGGKSEAEAMGVGARPRTIVDAEGGSEAGRARGGAEAGDGAGGGLKGGQGGIKRRLAGRGIYVHTRRRASGGGGGQGVQGRGGEGSAMMQAQLVIATWTSAMGVSAPRPNLRAMGRGMAGGAMGPEGGSAGELGEAKGGLVPGEGTRAAGVAWCAALGRGASRSRDFSSDQLLMSQSENWSDMAASVHGGRDARWTTSRRRRMVGRLPWQSWTSSGMLAGMGKGGRGAMICSMNLTWGRYRGGVGATKGALGRERVPGTKSAWER